MTPCLDILLDFQHESEGEIGVYVSASGRNGKL
jgi:hypothetical protein